jgi:hypothetical protein
MRPMHWQCHCCLRSRHLVFFRTRTEFTTTGNGALTGIAVGHSHLTAIVNASRLQRPDAYCKLEAISLASPRYDQTLGYDGPHRRYDPRIFADISDVIARTGPDFVLITLGGAEHFCHGAVNHPRPFQFILPNEAASSYDAGTELVPHDLVREQFRADMSSALHILAEIRSLAAIPMFYVSSPPPVGPSHLIAAHMPEAWRAEAERLGIPPPLARYRLWRIFTEICEELCREAYVDFLSVPPESISESGFLRERYRKDALHANEEYGYLVLRAVLERIQAQRKTG